MNLPKSRHIPLRRCISCRQSKSKDALLRFYKDDSSNWQFDKNQKMQTRGSWICKDSKKCYKTKSFKKYFGQSHVRIFETIKLNTNFQDSASLVNGG